jgi:hypothetical protein
MTAFTAYLTNAASTTLTTAEQLYSTSGTPTTATSATTKIGTATGYGELYSQGNASAWGAGGSAPAPSGHGFLWDVTTLEAQTMASGNWSATLNLIKNAGANAVADIHVRAYKRSSGGVYTSIVDMVLTAQTIDTFGEPYSLPSTSGSSTAFTTGDKLYIDFILNITTPGGLSTHTLAIQDLSADTSGKTGSTSARVISPGYSAGGGVVHLCISDGYGGVFS